MQINHRTLNIIKISELLGEEYSSDLKGILVFNVDYVTPFGGITVAKVFPNGDVKLDCYTT